MSKLEAMHSRDTAEHWVANPPKKQHVVKRKWLVMRITKLQYSKNTVASKNGMW